MAKKTKAEKNTSTPLPLMVWYTGMFFCTASLYAIGMISKDSSVHVYVVLGVIAMLITPVENMIDAVIENNKLKREYEERARKAAERRASLSEEERKEQEKTKSNAASEFAKRYAAKN